MLWVDKHRPKSLDKLVVHSRIGSQLKRLASSQNGDCPHVLFYGPPGAGKKTLSLAFLRELYGPGVDKLKVEHRNWQIQLPTRKIEVELATVSSNHHLEVNPSEAGRKDVHVVQEVIKEMARSAGAVAAGDKFTFKVLMINEVDSLSRHAQHALRRTMEKFSKTCRLVLVCNNLSKVIDPVRSRCICIRVKAPQAEEIQSVLKSVAKKEHLTLPDGLCARIGQHANRNMRRALLALETCKVSQYPFDDNQTIHVPEWELYVQEIAGDILRDQTPKNLFLVRGKLYELLINCIPADLIFRELCTALLSKLDDELKYETVKHAAFYEHRLQKGSKAIFHLEAFVARFMATYKEWTIKLYG